MRKCIIKLQTVEAAVDPKAAKKKEQYKKKLSNLKDNLKAGKARVADLEKQIKALNKEYGIKKVVKPADKNVRVVGNPNAASQRAKAKRLKEKLRVLESKIGAGKSAADQEKLGKEIKELRKQYKEMDRQSRMK